MSEDQEESFKAPEFKLQRQFSKPGYHGSSSASLSFLWGLPQIKALLDGFSAPKIPVPWLDKMVVRVPPVVAKNSAEAAVFNFNWLSATGSGIFIASLIAGLGMGYSFAGLARVYWQTLKLVRFSLLTISAMLAIGFTTRYSGLDATLGLAFAKLVSSTRSSARC
mgnify:CR=1 FL=1